MLARYQVVRGKRPPDNPLPKGRRIDTREHTRHCLRPEKSQVAAFIRKPSRAGFTRLRGRLQIDQPLPPNDSPRLGMEVDPGA